MMLFPDSRPTSAIARPANLWLPVAVIILLGFFSPVLAADQPQPNLHDEDGALMMLDMGKKPDNPGQGGGHGDDDDAYFIENTRLNDWPEHEKNWFAKVTRLANGDLGVIWTASFSIYYDGRYLMFARSSDEGDTWSYSLVADVSEAVLGEVYNIWRPHLCEMPDGALGVVWHGGWDTGLTIRTKMHFQRSDDGGATWTSPYEFDLPIPYYSNRSYYNPAIIAVDDVLIVTFAANCSWPLGHVFSARSTDGGATWQDTVNITDLFYVDTQYAQNNLVWNPVYEELAVALDVGGDIIIARSDDLGVSWNYLYRVPVTDETAYNPRYADMAVGPDGTYYVTWSDNGNNDLEIFLASSSDGGDTWTPTARVNDLLPMGNQYESHIAVDASGRVHVAWIWGKPGESDIDLYYTCSDNGGASWLSPNPMVNDVQNYVIPYVAYTFDITADPDGNAYLVWNDNRETDYGYTDIYFSRTAEVEEDNVVFLPSDRELDLQAMPNPFNPMTMIKFNLPKTSRVDLNIFDMRGRMVRTLLSGESLESGAQEVRWDGKDNAGRDASAGVYFYRLQGENLQETNRMTLVR